MANCRQTAKPTSTLDELQSGLEEVYIKQYFFSSRIFVTSAIASPIETLIFSNYIIWALLLQQPQATSSTPTAEPSLAMLGQNACSFDGNSDEYGLGIRLGVYLQWIASHIANQNVYAKEVIGVFLDTNTIFLMALLIATARLSLEFEST